MNPFEMRYKILIEARTHLFEQWEADINLAKERNQPGWADHLRDKRRPTTAEIKAYATELYEFVSRRD